MLCIFDRKQKLQTKRFHTIIFSFKKVLDLDNLIKQAFSYLLLKLDFELIFLNTQVN